MTLPRLLVLTDRRSCASSLVEVVRRAVRGGARAVVLRERDLRPDVRRRLAEEIRRVLEPVGGLLVLAGDDLPSDALHLPAATPVPRPRPVLVGRSCHDRAEVLQAAAERCDWITLGPWAPTESKPGYAPALDPAGFAELTRMPHAPPAYALGGVRPPAVQRCLAAGAYGVAVMGAVMRAERPDAVVTDLLERLPLEAPL